MELIYNNRFKKDLKALSTNRSLMKDVEDVLLALESAQSLSSIANVKKMSGAENLYRIRLGNYRIGVGLTGNQLTLYRFLHRKEMYRYFP